MTRLLPLLVASVLGCVAARPASAQETPPAEGRQILDGLASSFSLPLHELLKKRHESEWRNLLDGFAGNIGADSGARLSATVRYSPLGYWFGAVTTYRYLRPDEQKAWSPDFTYTFGYDDWHPYTLSLVYANYGGNRLRPSGSANHTELEEGGWTLGWKLKTMAAVDRATAFSQSGGTSVALHYSWTPRYTNASGSKERDKQKADVAMKFAIYKTWYASLTAFYYPKRHQQQPWDPDFTYGFGSFDWRPGTLSIQYNNYAGNRFPWRPRPGARFRDGSVSATWSWSSQ